MTFTIDTPSLPARSWKQAMRRGMLLRCPNCGIGPMFRSFLKANDRCPLCGEDLHHHRADDAPPYFTMLIVGHIVVPLVLVVEKLWAPSLWLHFIIWLPLTLVMTVGLLPPVKGAIIALQWANRMHGFGGRDGA